MARNVDPLETMPVSRHASLQRWGLRALFAFVILFLYLPIVLMVAFSFDTSATPGLPIQGLTLHWYEVMLKNKQLLAAVQNTVTVSLVVAVLATIIGTMAAFVLVRGRLRYPNAIRILFTLPIMVPGVLIGISLLIFFSRAAHANLSLMTVIAGQLVVTVPFVVLIVASRLQSFDRKLEWAAADLGASPRRTLRHVVLPLIAPAIMAGALICVTLSIDEFVITWFTVGNQPTLPTYIYTKVKFGVTPEINAVATVMLVATLLIFGIASLVLGRARSSSRRRPATRGGVPALAVEDAGTPAGG